MSDFDKTTLTGLYKYLNPAGYTGSDPVVPRAIDKKRIFDILMETCLNCNGIYYDWKKFSEQFEAHYKKGTKEQNEINDVFHAIGESKLQGTDDEYWGEKVESIKSLLPDVIDSNFSVSVFVTRDPMLSPATRGTTRAKSINSSKATNPIDFFLNFIPSYFASQMVPYLQVEFEIARVLSDKSKQSGKSYISTPSMMRFFLGSSELSKLSPIDRVIEKSGYNHEDGTVFSGMEMFLMPQTLTNMDSDGTSLISDNSIVRISPPKPFAPLASIEGFDVKSQNAGAGAFAHRTATLRMKIHDKARLSEFAELIRGGPGFDKAKIWTTYGWMAPRGRGDEDAYAEFINNNMITRDCWKIKNTQFSFDAVGTVSLSIELVSAAYKNIESKIITSGLNDDTSKKLDELREIFKGIKEIKSKLEASGKFSIPVFAEQVFNAASTDGVIPEEIKNVELQINSILKSAANKLSKEDSDFLADGLKKVAGKNSEYSYDGIKQKINASVSKLIDSMMNREDPFLPSSNSKKQKYFNDELVKKTEAYSNKNYYDKQQKALNESKAGKKNTFTLKSNKKVVSFGNLFLNFILPGMKSVLKQGEEEEVQVFFYSLNDQCGPASDHSIAEFPIDITSLMYAYAEALKEKNTSVLNIESFLKLVIDTQFVDPRGIGYGMYSFYKPRDYDKPKEYEIIKDNNGAIDNAFSQWCIDYGCWKPPLIEFYVEMGSDPPPTAAELLENMLSETSPPQTQGTATSQPVKKKTIKRIHIYDRQCNPYRLLQQFIDSEENDEILVGEIDKNRIDAVISSKIKKIKEDQKNNLIQEIRKSKTGEELAAALKAYGVSSDDINSFSTVKMPAGEKITLKKTTSDFKTELSRYAPTLRIGLNSTMINTANVASKTDGLMGSINMIYASKGQKSGKPTASDDGLFDLGGLPLRTVPVQLTLSTMGVPTAQLYQSYFIDFDTGTTIDNIYNCTQLTHNITPGKFTTSWTFAYLNGYGRFGNPRTKQSIINGTIIAALEKVVKK